MAGISYTFNGRLFEIKGIGLTAEQLKAIGDQQATTGSLIGLKPGDVLSAATQARAGLQSAQAQVGQALSGVTGALGAGIPGATGILGSVSKSLASVGGALSGSLSAGVTGLTGAIGPAVSKLQGAFAGAGSSITSLATTAIGTLNKAISGGIPIGSPINAADFVKQIPALGSVGSLSTPDVTGLLAQTKNLVGQAASKLSNFKGVGSFGLDVPQLETAGILKPGTSALQAASGASLRDMLKSASAFTGKLGIKSAEALLANAPAQAQIQQELMVKGLAGAAALGIPTGILSGPALGAVSVLAAKSVSNAVSWLKGAPAAAGIPTSAATAAAAIAPGVTNADVARMSAYSVNLTKEKVPEVFKAQVIPTPAVDTCNRDTVTAATDGQLDPKIPAPTFTKTDSDPVTGSKRDAITAGFDAALSALENSNKQFENVLLNLQVLENQQAITQQQFDSIATEWKAAAAYGDNARKTIIDPAFALYETAVSSYSPGISERAVGLLGIRNTTSPVRIQFYQLTSAINSEQRVQLIRATGLANRIKELKKRISTNVS